MSRILVTGANGFIGTRVVKRIFEMQPDAVVGMVDSFEPRVHGDDIDDDERCTCAEIPIEELIASDIIIHLAAQVGVFDSMNDPLRYVVDNTWDTATMLKNLKIAGAQPKRLIVASSMSIYGDPQTSNPISEDHPPRPASVYGLTKFDQEALCLMYGDMLGIPTAALRFFNVYGPGQALTNPYTGVLAIFASAFLEKRVPLIFEDGLQTRDFIYVDDVVEAITRMALETDASGVFNVATGRPTTLLGAAEALAKGIHGGESTAHVTNVKRPGDIRHCIGDASKLRAALPGWEPRAFEEGILLYTYDLKARNTPG